MKRKLPDLIPFRLLAAVVAVVGSLAASGVQANDEPPVMQFPSDGIGLLDAARLALEHDPNIKLQEATTEFQQGLAQEQTGRFDSTLLGDLNFEYRQQELRESVSEREQDKRDEMDEAIADNQQNAEDGRALRDALQDAQAGDPNVVLPDPELQLQLELIDALIDQAPDPAAEADLRALRDDFLQLQLDKTIRAANEADDDAKDILRDRRKLGDTPEDEELYNAQLQLRSSKQFRNGISIAPFVEGSADGNRFKDKRRDSEHGGKGIEDLFIFRVGVDSVFPLLRGRGSDATGAFEKAAQIEHDASLSLLKHQASLSVLGTVLAYWDLRATQDLVTVAQKSVDLQERLVEATEGLINAGDMARVDLARVQASQARAQARLDDAERRLHQARVGLALVMGVAVTDEKMSLPLARDGFPDLPEMLLGVGEMAALAQEAMGRRQDLLAARTLEEAGQVLVRGAQTDTRSKLDLRGSVWATALGESEVANAVDRWVAPSFEIGLGYEKPIGNNLFRGRLTQREADLRQRAINAVDLQRQIKLEIVKNARSLTNAAERVRQAQMAVEYYQRTIDTEIGRLIDGNTTLIDTILTEDQQTGALSELVLAQQSFAKLLAQLRFETGQIATHATGGSAVAGGTLVTLPAPYAGRTR